ncbi:MAG: HAD family hydrolase [Pygmaiobacter sp.]
MDTTSLVIWDWNGTLFDDVAVSIETINHLLTRHNYAPLAGLGDYHAKFCFPILQYYKNLGIDFERTSFQDMAQEFMEIYHTLSAHCCLQPDAETTLSILQKQGIHQVLLSASMQQHLERQVDCFPIRSYFDQLLGIRNIYAKSKLYLATHFIADCGVDPRRVVFVGDSVHDNEVATACGCDCVLYCGGHQSRKALLDTGRTVIESLNELIEYCCPDGIR